MKHWALGNIWNLSTLQIEQLDKYYLLHWEPDYFVQQVSYGSCDHPMIKREGICYKLRLLGFSLQDCVFDKTVRLSFRKHKDEDCGFVLVKRNLLNEQPN